MATLEVAGGRGRQLPVVSFLVLAFVWSWACWWSAAAAGLGVTEPAGLLLYLLGVFGPLAGATWVLQRAGSAYRRQFLRRIWDPRGVPGRWWLALVAVAVGPAALGAVGSSLAGRAVLAGGLTAGGVLALAGPALVAGLAEEPGWRGVALDAWQIRTRPVVAALGIGGLWSLWHLPLSFVEGSYYHDLGAGSVRVWFTHLMLVLLGVLLVWLVNGSGGSILVAILAHTGFNTAMGVVAGSTARDVAALLGLAAAASAAIILSKGEPCFPSTAGRDQHGRLASHATPPSDGPSGTDPAHEPT